MPAKDYEVVVSGLMGTVYIAKVSKSNKNLMLSDRKQLDDGYMYQLIEQFAKARIKEGFCTLEVTTIDKKPVMEIYLANPKITQRHNNYKKIAQDILTACDGVNDDRIREMPGIPLTLISLAKMVVELTS